VRAFELREILRVFKTFSHFENVGTRKAEVLNSLIINTTAKANDTTENVGLMKVETL